MALITFAAGTPALASEVNSNFAQVVTLTDSGWQNLSILSGWQAGSGQTPQFRRAAMVVNGVEVYVEVALKGIAQTISGSNVTGTHNPVSFPNTTLGNSCVPSSSRDAVVGLPGGGTAFAFIATDRSINCTFYSASPGDRLRLSPLSGFVL